MTTEDLSHDVPNTLDDPLKLLFWDIDVAVIALIGIVGGIGANHQVLGLGSGIGLAWAYGKYIKTGTHPGSPFHLLGWITGQPSLTDLPNTHLRDFHG